MKVFRWTALCAVAALAATAVSWADGERSSALTSSTINACKNDQNGNVRIVASAGACRNAESFLSWNAQGLKGDRGPAGAVGPAGPAGAQGSTGPKGDPGAKGDTGLTGPAGADGVDGVDGAPGVDGTDGAPGADGSDGADGAPGADGSDGAAGAPGADGVSVASAAEPAGANCANGGSRFTVGPSLTFACNGSDGNASGAPGFERVGTQYIAYGASTQVSSVPGFGVVNIRCLGNAGSDVELSNPAGSGVLLTIATGYYAFTIPPGGATGWAAAGSAPRLVITSASLAGGALRVLVVDVAIPTSGTSCAYLVRSSVS